MMKSALSLLLCLLLPFAEAWGASQMKPGLWEITVKSDSFKNMPQIPAEQLRAMRQMGIEMPQMRNGSMVTQACITKEMSQRGQPLEMSLPEAGCRSQNARRSGDSYGAEILCDGPLMKGMGKINGSLSGAERFTSTYDFKGSVHGQAVEQHHENEGKWLSADCGSVKPMTEIMPNR